ncbi:hypothetical protein JTB14_012943 [Gonioctena quinquepunctata]|nr:hypothetical protein JTB14_012943 [Gonioctena quinquepunctata]
MRGVIVLTLAVIVVLSNAKENDTIVLLHVFSRHGARTPELKDTYPNDPHKLNAFLPTGYGHLTEKGKLQCFTVGKTLRARYASFLGEIFYPDMVYAQSTDYDRTKMTASLILAGMFPPSPTQTWSEDLAWLPIPVAYKEHHSDHFLKRPNEYCPSYLRKLNSVLQSKENLDYLKDKNNLLEYLAKHTGKPFTTLQNVFEIEEVAKRQCYLENSTPLLRRLNGGRSLQRVLKNIDEKTKNKLVPENRKVFLHSGHENNINNILGALGFDLNKEGFPNYAATLIFELHSLGQDKYAIKLLYLKKPDGLIEEKEIEGCEAFCPLEKFIELTKTVIPTNFSAECETSIDLDQ